MFVKPKIRIGVTVDETWEIPKKLGKHNLEYKETYGEMKGDM